MNRNFTGLIANQLLSKYQHPILLLSEIKNKDGSILWEGSARSYDCEGLDNFKEYLKNNSYVYLSEGHKNAFGVGLTDEGFSNFIKETNEELSNCTFNPSHTVDFIWEANDIDKRPTLPNTAKTFLSSLLLIAKKHKHFHSNSIPDETYDNLPENDPQI